MNLHYSLLSFLLAGAIFLIMLMGLVVSIVVPWIDQASRRFFILLYLVYLLATAGSILDMIIYGDPAFVLLERVDIFFESLLFSVPFPLTTAYLVQAEGQNWKKSRHLYLILGLWFLYVCLLVLNEFTACFFYLSPENLFYSTGWYPFMLIPHVLILLVNYRVLTPAKGKLPKNYYNAFLLCTIVTTVVILLYILKCGVIFNDIGAAICSMIIFISILLEKREIYLRQQSEIAKQRASIMVLQMRPQFIYNTMTSIYYLCEADPQKAQQVTLDFTTYLRKNFTAIASAELIPFSEELEHALAYLAVEKAQYEERLIFNLDTPHTSFSLPPLTLQPLVENAIKHGMDPNGGPLHLVVQTRKTETGSEILVKDNGSGFDPADESTPWPTLDNIRQRLKIMCNGHLKITSCQGGGTVVQVTIPG